MNTPHVNVLIATPGHSVLPDYVKSLLGTCELLGLNKMTFAYLTGYSSHVADAREVTLSGTRVNDITDSRPLGGQVTYDTILWIDSDIVWNPEDALKLIQSDKEIITGAYLMADATVPVYAKMLQRSYTIDEVKEKTELEEVDGCGFGFVAIKQGVFEKLSRPWFQSVNRDVEVGGKTYNFNVIGEDLSWCARAKELGFAIWFDPTVRVIHHKTFKLTWEGIMP